MRAIPLLHHKFTLVDDIDHKWLRHFSWCLKDTGYVATYVGSGINKQVYLHRLILKVPNGKYTDHINGNTLDNRRCNLRICDLKSNIRNGKIRSNNTSGYKGVVWIKNRKRWRAQIMVNYKYKYIKQYKTKIEAARAYNEAAIKYFGEFARLNET